jgi:hypothetical protein
MLKLTYTDPISIAKASEIIIHAPMPQSNTQNIPEPMHNSKDIRRSDEQKLALHEIIL